MTVSNSFAATLVRRSRGRPSLPWTGAVTALLALFWLLPGSRADAELSLPGFSPATLDGVTEIGPAGRDGTAYRFAGGQDWPALRFRAAAPLDWSRAAALTVPVENLGDRPFTLLLRLDDDPNADGGDRSLTGMITLAPHERGAAVLPLAPGPGGMRGRPVTVTALAPGERAVTDLRGALDPRHVVALHVSGVRTDGDRTLVLGTPVLRDRPPGERSGGAIVDGYGQAIAGSWPEKVGSDAELRAKLATAEAQTRRLAALPRVGTERASGGTGFFRTEKANGRWRFVSPAGQPFFSLGVDAVSPANPTIVSGREALFADLPAPGTPLARFFDSTPEGTRVFDVGAADLARVLGADWRRRWAAHTVARLTAWGFNTLGNWSDPDLAASGLAAVDFYDVQGDSALVPGADGRVLPDPFDPRFPAVADAVATQMTARHRGSHTFLGYFSGNEMPWGGADRPDGFIAARVLRLGPDSPAKQALVAQLRGRYGTTGALAAAWGTRTLGGDWAALLARAVPFPASPTGAARADAARFGGVFADRYFAAVSRALKAQDPDHLYLGVRFADAPAEVVAACARWCDVLSFNVYGASPEVAAARWRTFDRPVLIGEFHFGSTDRGAFWPGMVDAGSEARRGPAYAAYVEAALRDPAIVGVHWYQYADEPVTGRPFDGENGHIGLVAVTDVPFSGFIEDIARANTRALAGFAAATSRPARTVP